MRLIKRDEFYGGTSYAVRVRLPDGRKAGACYALTEERSRDRHLVAETIMMLRRKVRAFIENEKSR